MNDPSLPVHPHDVQGALRALPAVDALLGAPELRDLLEGFGHDLVKDAVRADLEVLRRQIRAGEVEALVPGAFTAAACAERVSAALAARTRPAYVRALNATGVVLHTGLGRAPLPASARQALDEVARGYAVLEVDRASGERNERDAPLSRLVAELCGAEAAIVVNNNAGATLLALAALAAGRPVVVSRGQLVEIGGSFRIPDVMAQSGARLVEVGCTNRTHLRDYARALDVHGDAALLLRVHTSNYRIEGFTAEVPLRELARLARERSVLLMDDLGSGCLVDLTSCGLPQEPLVGESVAAGADVITFSGDKLLGGPQAGLIVGRRTTIGRLRAHPLYRALRPDKLTLAALEATLVLYRDPARARQEVPALRMLACDEDQLLARAERMAVRLTGAAGERLEVGVERSTSRVGGGSYAVEELPTRVVTLRPARGTVEQLAAALRDGQPPLFARIREGRLLLDPRTLLGPAEDAEAVVCVLAAVGAGVSY